MMRQCRGQGTVEYTILVIILIGALIGMSQYLKRGFSGRWRTSVDDLGDQYDPNKLNSFVNYSMVAQSNSVVNASPTVDPITGVPGFTTNRIDLSNAVETKQGYVTIGPP